MNELEEARNKLVERFPRKSISVGCQACFDCSGANVEVYTEYVITVDPGFDYAHQNFAQNFGGNSLQECLNKFNTAAEGND